MAKYGFEFLRYWVPSHSRPSSNLLRTSSFERRKIEISRIAAQVASYQLLALYLNQANDRSIFLGASKVVVLGMFNQLSNFRRLKSNLLGPPTPGSKESIPE